MSRQGRRREARLAGAARPSPTPPWLGSLALALLGGILMAAPFLQVALWPLHYVALVPWALLLVRPTTERPALFLFIGAFCFLMMALGPFSLFHLAVPFVAAALYAPFVLPFGVLLPRIRHRFPVPLTVLVPVAWVATEWFRFQFSVGQAALFPMGTSQFRNTTLIQIADLTGTYGVSFLLALVSGAVADVVLTRRRWSWETLWPVGLAPLGFALALSYGVLQRMDEPVAGGLRLAIVQPNTTHYRDPARAPASFLEQLEFTRRHVPPGAAHLIAWPENAVDVPLSDDPRYHEGLAALARSQQAHVVAGAFSWASQAPPRVHTSAYYFSAEGELIGRYDKLHLIPWAEYLPFQSWFPREASAIGRAHAALTRRLLGYPSIGRPGRELVVFAWEGGDGNVQRFAVPICFEVSSAGFARLASDRGADFLLNITSEGFLGPPIYVHMLAHATFRAVENRMAVVRVANTGISGVIAPNGRAQLLRSAAGRLYLDAGVLLTAVPARAAHGRTFYSRYGDVLAYLCVVASMVLFAATFVRRRPSASSANPTSSTP